MKQIKCIIVEDERIAREGLQHYLSEYNFLQLVGSFSNANDALLFLKDEAIDLVFLDIEMPGMKGIDMAKILEGFLPQIIFTTAYPHYAVEGFRTNAIGYLVKPIFPNDFRDIINKVKNTFNFLELKEVNFSKKIVLKSDGEWIRLSPPEILYIMSMQNYVIIHLKDGKKIILQTMKEILKLLPDFFVQIHRSYSVNIHQIQKMSDTQLYVNNERIPISRTRKKIVKELFFSQNRLDAKGRIDKNKEDNLDLM